MTQYTSLIIFFLLLGLGLLETYLLYKWNIPYFLKGIGLFSRKFTLNKEYSVLDINLAHLEDKFDVNSGLSIKFEQLDSNSIGFREEMFAMTFSWYRPLMHGVITIDEINNVVEVKGVINGLIVFIPFFLLPIIGIPLSTSLVIAAIWGAFMIKDYIIQRKRYALIADEVNVMLAQDKIAH